MKYLSTFEVAEKWGISPRRVGILCNNDRIPGAQRAGSRWIIPEDAEKPTDARIKSGKYIKQKADREGGSIMADTYLKEIKKEAGSDLAAARAISKEATEKMFTELTKGQDMQNPTITPEAVVNAITGSISGVDGVNQEALDNFNKALLGLMQTMVLPEDDGQDN